MNDYDEYDSEFEVDGEGYSKLDAVKQWAVDRPVAAAVAAGVALSLVVGAVALPFVLGGDEPAGPERGIVVEQNPTGSKPTHKAQPPKEKEITGKNSVNINTDAPVMPPPPQDPDAPPPPPDQAPAPVPARIDNVSEGEVQRVREMNIPAPQHVDPAPQAAQHQLAPPVPGVGAAEAVEGAQQADPEVHNAMEIRGQRVPVLPMSVNEDNVFLPPENVGQVGWYQDSAEPGTNQEGSIVMSSHINSAQQGNGIGSMFTLLKEGEEITLWNTEGKKTTWRITKTYAAPKSGELPEIVQKSDGEQVLVLVTCSGEYIGPPVYYQDNTIVEAVEVK